MQREASFARQPCGMHPCVSAAVANAGVRVRTRRGEEAGQAAAQPNCALALVHDGGPLRATLTALRDIAPGEGLTIGV